VISVNELENLLNVFMNKIGVQINPSDIKYVMYIIDRDRDG